MTQPRPALGLLLDVDGPLASPITRTINIPEIAFLLVELAHSGVPVVFNTGRSDAFLREVVLPPLLRAGLRDDVRLYGVCEKGAVWFRMSTAGVTDLTLDPETRVPAGLAEWAERLVAERFSDSVFFDPTKRAMVSVEQRTDVASAAYLEVQPELDAAVYDWFVSNGHGVVWGDIRTPDAHGRTAYRIDPTIISTDVESALLGKDRGAQRAFELIEADGEPPLLWRTMGDSRTDYAMADWLHERGYEVEHADVRPADGLLAKPYPVCVAGDLIHDDAGVVFLREWLELVNP
ncbi:hypothetical protein GCM10022198_23120 [Klugiella xanthotipulae]|uniref:Hydroxymethylpyrimidine pyrophosphatase-like HAD family hydrolase n=1 Tax=Klugiella xanthotipulae TaxID=244735 RepID=A0A543I656_9MICO|nr:hypothetical protein [Klugiella xanthotipulae]TQM65960.1 hypothetical protein FB466_0780 [Klugiella xanthotipulae]